MARPREFDTEAALEAAMQVFWARGYEASSMSDLLAAMGIARGSLYKAFKDKRSVYLAALERYEAGVVAPVLARLADPSRGTGRARVREFLQLAAEAAAVEDRRGCLLCNAAIDQAATDPETRTKVLAMLRRIERAIAAALADGWAGSAQARTAAARQLATLYLGLRVLARAGYPPGELEGVIAAGLAAAEAKKDGAP